MHAHSRLWQICDCARTANCGGGGSETYASDMNRLDYVALLRIFGAGDFADVTEFVCLNSMRHLVSYSIRAVSGRQSPWGSKSKPTIVKSHHRGNTTQRCVRVCV